MATNQLTFTRFLAAIVIVIFHFGQSVYPFNQPWAANLFSNIGVSYFFVLSGFVMVIAYGKSSTPIAFTAYLKNRIARIYPVYALALLSTIGLFALYRLNINSNAVTLQLLLLQAWVSPYPLSLNAPGWTLSVEMFFYISFPFLFNYWYRKKSVLIVAFYIVIIWILSQLCYPLFVYNHWYKGFGTLSHDVLYYLPLMHINQFMVGNLFGLLFLRNYSHGYKKLDFLVITLVIIMTAMLKIPIPFANYHNGFMAIIFGIFIYYLSLNTGFISRLFSQPLCIFLGEISFGIYILQAPLQKAMYYLFKNLYHQNHSLFFVSYFLALLIIASLSYLFVEKPMRNLLKKL